MPSKQEIRVQFSANALFFQNLLKQHHHQQMEKILQNYNTLLGSVKDTINNESKFKELSIEDFAKILEFLPFLHIDSEDRLKQRFIENQPTITQKLVSAIKLRKNDIFKKLNIDLDKHKDDIIQCINSSNQQWFSEFMREKTFFETVADFMKDGSLHFNIEDVEKITNGR